jgi:hypothetical protein
MSRRWFTTDLHPHISIPLTVWSEVVLVSPTGLLWTLPVDL